MPSLPVLISILLLMAAPGPTNALLASHGATSGGFRALVPVAAAYGVALTAYAMLLPFFSNAPQALVALKLICAAWLCVLAARCWRATQVGAGGGFFMTTLLNPKAAFLALVLPPSMGALALDLIGIGCAMAAGALWLLVGVGAGRMGAGPYAAKASALVSATAAGVIIASVAA